MKDPIEKLEQVFNNKDLPAIFPQRLSLLFSRLHHHRQIACKNALSYPL
jgi:hypothetical protein